MPNTIRYWSRHGTPPPVQSDGYLSAYANERASLLTTTQAVAGRCTVLLGDSGMGKSTTAVWLEDNLEAGQPVFAFDLKQFASSERLHRRVFKSPALTAALRTVEGAHLVLDSYDRAGHILEDVADVLADGLGEVAHDRLRLTVLCRTSDWQSGLGDKLIEILKVSGLSSPESGPDVFELAPLAAADVAGAAVHRGIDADAFVHEITTRAAEALAARPITLNMMLDLYERDGSLAAGHTQAALYRSGIERMLEEADIQTSGGLAGTHLHSRMAAAQRIAAVLTMSGREVLWTGNVHRCPREAVPLRQLVGGHESYANTRHKVEDGAALKDCLNTALMVSDGPNRHRFYHLTAQEYLAAQALSTRPEESVKALLLAGDGVPLSPLTSVTSWLIAINSRYSDLAKRDPVAFAIIGREFPNVELRSVLVDGVLERAAESRVRSYFAGNYRALRHSGLGMQTLTTATDVDKPLNARYLAIELASLVPEETHAALAELALNRSEDAQLRARAARVVAATGNDSSSESLLPLVRDPGEDSFDEIRASALKANFRTRLSLLDTLEALAPPAEPGITLYTRFIEEIANGLKVADLYELMPWLLQHSSEAWPEEWFAPIWNSAIQLAWKSAEDPVIRSHLMDLIQTRTEPLLIHKYRQPRLPSVPPATRHVLIEDLVALDQTVRLSNMLLWVLDLLDPTDLAWVVAKYESVESELEKHQWKSLVPRVFNHHWEEHQELLDALEAGSDARRLLEEAKQHRIDYDTRYRDEPSSPDLTTDQLARRGRDTLSGLFSEVEADPIRVLPQITYWLTFDASNNSVSPDFEDLRLAPGWADLTTDQVADFTRLAKVYLQSNEVDSDYDLLRPRSWAYIAAYQLTSYLLRVSPSDVAELAPWVWQHWAHTLFSATPRSHTPDHKEIQNEIYQYLQVNASAELLASVQAHIKASLDSRDFRISTEKLQAIYSPVLGDLLQAAVSEPSAAAQQRIQVFETLSVLDPQRTRSIVEPALRSRRTSDGSSDYSWDVQVVSRALYLTPLEYWTDFEAQAYQDPDFVREVAYCLSHQLDSIYPVLTPAQLADFYCYTNRHAIGIKIDFSMSGQSDPEGHVAFARGHILEYLVSLATHESVTALKSICAEVPNAAVFLDAGERAVRDASHPLPSAEDVVSLLIAADRRVVQSDPQLNGVVLESLERFRLRLSGQKTPQAFTLWDERSARPKVEDRCSDLTADHLNQDLTQRGVVVNREVEIRRRVHAGVGERTDLLVEAYDRFHKARVAIEVKGCWHDKILTGMRDQLVNRYLIPTNRKSGIYLVFWFRYCRQANPSTPLKSCDHPDLDILRSELESQAEELRAEGFDIHAIVLDGTIEFTARKPKGQ